MDLTWMSFMEIVTLLIVKFLYPKQAITAKANVFFFNIAVGPTTDEGMYYGSYQAASPVDSLLQIESQSYLQVTWNRLGYSTDRTDRINSFQ